MNEQQPIAEFTIERDLALASKNRAQRYAYSGNRKEIGGQKTMAKLVAIAGWRDAGSPGFYNEGPVEIELEVRRARALDSANVVHAWAPYQDALFCRKREGEGITPDDSPQWIPQPPRIRWTVGREWKGKEEIVVRVYTVPR
jgi:hypothetical protein